MPRNVAFRIGFDGAPLDAVPIELPWGMFLSIAAGTSGYLVEWVATELDGSDGLVTAATLGEDGMVGASAVEVSGPYASYASVVFDGTNYLVT